ncbi:MAG TPA: alpha-amylase family glycosyl hydrolase [Kiritimatiellia bacterium]|nr:alpha-amylase family glycosyl hydrolase [Kiritimatiellia bacterium]
MFLKTVLALLIPALGILALPKAVGQSARPGWGATPYTGPDGAGVTFRTWAPNASSVTVAGNFNGWNTLTLPLSPEGNGIWSRDVANIGASAQYKFVINGNLWRRDPYSQQNVGSGTRNSIVVDHGAFNWGGEKSFVIPPPHELVIYELHVGAFFAPQPGLVGRFTNVIAKLDHLVDLGINAIELMPVNDFASITSWGYNPSYPFAIEPSYGSPDDLKRLVKASHERGIAVLMDMVHNHWGSDENDWSLWQYDGWSGTGSGGGIFFFEEPGWCCTWWGPRPDYRRPEVQDYILENFRMWKRDYRIDGFRWDAPQFMLYTDNTRSMTVPGASNLIDLVISTLSNEYDRTYHIAEDIKGVVGFNSHWDFSFHSTLQNIMAQGSDNNRNMINLAGIINHEPNRIIYSESHDTTGDLNNGRRLPVAIHGEDPESYFARKRTGLAALFTLTAPGTPMIWMGQEMLATNVFGDLRPLDWERTNTFAETTRLYRDLIRLRRNLDGLSAGLLGPNCGMFLIDNSAKLIGYRRYTDDHPEQDVVVLANLRNATVTNRSVTFPRPGPWYVHFNSDSLTYGADYSGTGPGYVIASGSPPAAEIDLGPYSALILSQTPDTSVIGIRLDLDDTTLGNANHILEPGETLFANLIVFNSSPLPAQTVTAELQARHPDILIKQPIVHIPFIDPGGVVTSTTRFVFHLPSDWICGTPVELDVILQHPGGQSYLTEAFPSGSPSDLHPATSTFLSPDVPQDILDNQTIYSELLIDQPSLGAIQKVVPRLRIDHTWNSDMIIALQHPDGTEILLADRRGGSGENYGDGDCGSPELLYTVFDDQAPTAIAAGTSPFTGAYQPETPLAALNGKPANGLWRLRITDVFPLDPGVLHCWELEIDAIEIVYACDATPQLSLDTDGDGLPDWWELAFFGGPTNAIAHQDYDSDGYTNLEEYLAGTDPLNPDSFLRLAAIPDAHGEPAVQLHWPSATDRTYTLWFTPDLADSPFEILETGIPATPILNIWRNEDPALPIGFYLIELDDIAP